MEKGFTFLEFHNKKQRNRQFFVPLPAIMNRLCFTRYIILFLLLATTARAEVMENVPADSLLQLSRLYYQEDRLIEALDLATLSLRQAKKESNRNVYMAGLANIAGIYGVFKDYDRADHYFKLCLQEAIALKEEDMMARCYSNLTMTSCMLGNTNQARHYLGMQNRCRMKDSVRQHFFFLSNQGKVAACEGKWRQAYYFAEQARRYAANHQMGLMYEASEVGEMAGASESLGDDSLTVALYREMLEMVMKVGDMKGASRAYDHLANVYLRLNNPIQAAIYRERSVRLNDSVFNTQDFNRVKERLSDFEEEQKAEQISLLHGRITQQLLVIGLIVVLLVAVVIMSVILIRRNRSLIAAYQVLVEKNREDIRRNKENTRTNEGEHLPEEQHRQLLEAIEKVMDADEMICNPDFDLAALCTQVDSNAKYVSWVINDHYRLNFKALLNKYRIQLASKRLADEENYGNLTIQAIAESVGYKSQTNFIQTFKSIVGMTPSTYQKIAKQEQYTLKL